jgi:LuxR family maltose regulon positive regulatory protein
LENLDTPASCGVLLARVQLARGDIAGATALLAEAERFVRRNEFAHRMPEVAEAQALAMLQRDNVTAAAALAEAHDLPLTQARVRLAQEDPASALALLEPMRRRAQGEGRLHEQRQVAVLQALAHQAQGETDEAVQRLADALALAEPGDFIRLFVDEGPPMSALLCEAAQRGIAPAYVQRLQAAFPQVEEEAAGPQQLPDPLTDRELDVLRLLATELNGPQIARELMVSLNTMRTHTKNIYSKLGANNRRMAVRRAEELGLL